MRSSTTPAERQSFSDLLGLGFVGGLCGGQGFVVQTLHLRGRAGVAHLAHQVGAGAFG
jgi:hypothetical protein